MINQKLSDKNIVSKVLNSYFKILSNADLNAHVSFNYYLINKLLFSQPFLDEDLNLQKDKELFPLIYALKDNFATKNLPMTIGCQFLRNFYPFYDSTVFQRLNKSGAQLICKANLDELSMAGTGIFSLNGAVKNPWNKLHISGGSSSGSAVLVASGLVDFSIGTDTGDSIRKPAGYCGVVGYKPSWGIISRYGLADYAPSLDTIGVIANSVQTCLKVTNQLVGYDDKDFSTALIKNQGLNFKINLNSKKKYKFFVINDILNDKFENGIEKNFLNFLEKLKKAGHSVDYISFDISLLSSLNACYEIISYAEASSCNSNLLGLTFGENTESHSNDWFSQITENRTKFLGSMVKRRFAIGSFVLSSENKAIYFEKAKLIRKILIKKMKTVFQQYDCLIAPTSTNLAPLISNFKLEDPFYDHENSITSNQLLIANFCGSPSISIPLTLVDNLPTSLTLTANSGEDQMLFNIAYCLEKLIKFKNPFLTKTHEK